MTPQRRELEGLRVEVAELRERARVAEHDREVLRGACAEIVRNAPDRIARPPAWVAGSALKRLGKPPTLQTGMCDAIGHTYRDEDSTNCRVCGRAWEPPRRRKPASRRR